MPNDHLLERTALVTGASRRVGLGFAVARRLAMKGHRVFLTARDPAQGRKRAAELRDEGLHVTAACLDLADTSSVDELIAVLTRSIDHLDVLVNNASTMPDFRTQSLLDMDADALRALFDVNVVGCWRLTQALLPLLRRAPAARIVNVTSAAAQQIGGHASKSILSPAYSLAKYSLNAMTGALAAALADTPILVNAVDPGSVASHPERGDDRDDRSPADAAEDIVRAATLGDDGPTGGLFRNGELVEMVAR